MTARAWSAGCMSARAHRTQENENLLLTAVLDALWKTPACTASKHS